jgi:DGQHR domain-containing protein
MPDNNFIEFPCLQVVQPIGTFYVGSMDFSEVTFISYSDVRRIEKREVEQFVGIERPLVKDRVEELRRYVKTIDAAFPTSVILAIASENAEYDEDTGLMRVKKQIDIAKIIDGQHRIAGLLNYEGPTFQMNVTLFVDMDIEDQALLFATINLKQTKVGKSLAYDLYEFAVTRSPQKTCHNIAKLLNYEAVSPLKNRIKILGRATGKPFEFLTQAAVVEQLIKYISRDPMKDRDLFKRRKKAERATPTDEKFSHLIFRNMFLDNRDDDIALVLYRYFTVVANRSPKAWNTDETGFILNRTTGFVALMRLLPFA